MDLGKQRKAQAAPSGSPWLAMALIVAIAIATLGVVWFTTGSGIVSGTLTASPAADHRYDQIEAQRGGTVFAADDSYNQVEAGRAGAFPGKAADDSMTQAEGTKGGAFSPAKRDRVGGP
jgi:general stress protein YciG